MWTALWFCVDRGKMGVWIECADEFQGFAAVDQIVDNQDTCTVAHKCRIGCFQNLGLRLILVVVAFDADRIDGPDIQFARSDHRRGHAATGDRHNGAPRAIVRTLPVKPPRSGTAVAVDLIPTDVEPFFMRQTVGHRGFVLFFCYIGGVDGFHTNNVVTRIDVKLFAGHGTAEVGQEVEG